MPRVVISGVGLVSPLGGSAWETFRALLAGRTLARRAAALPDDIEAVDLVRAVGGVSLAQHTATDVAVELAERAAREALFMAGADGPIETLLGASKGAVHALSDMALRHLRSQGVAPRAPVATSYLSTGRPDTLTPAPPGDLPLAVALGPHGYLAAHLRQRLGLGLVAATVAACASSLTAIHQARMRLLHDPDAPRQILVVTSEAALLAAFVHSYNRLGVLPPLTTQDYLGRPLDRRRQGFMLAEVGAAAVLERVDDGRPLPAHAAELLDTAIAADAFDLVQPSPDMPALRHVASRLLAGRKIDLLHPHATGTREHDAAEIAVYDALLADPQATDVYACKGALGHGLGSAGLASLVLACLCARAKRRPPMPWLEQPIETRLALRSRPALNAPLETQAVFSAGFAGHVAGAVIRSHPAR